MNIFLLLVSILLFVSVLITKARSRHIEHFMSTLTLIRRGNDYLVPTGSLPLMPCDTLFSVKS